jgi:glutamyl-Q tRNA(Asp) synthetase
MEDLDRPRCRQAHADDILRTLERFGLGWDGEVLYQSRRDYAYVAALAAIENQGLLYACTCRRRDHAATAPGHDGPRYPGICRHLSRPREGLHALRVQAGESDIGFTDDLQGIFTQRVAQEVGDFILRRADGLFAYQLAVVVDDAFLQINHVVRGADLLASTPRQIYLQRVLGLETPGYLHVPLLVGSDGQKISKQNHADPVSRARVSATLVACLDLLGQSPPGGLHSEERGSVLRWAVEHWNPQKIPRVQHLHRVISTE